MAGGGLAVSIRHIEPGDRLTGLSLGDAQFAPLKIFLQRHAQAYEAQSLTRTYGAFDAATGRIVGYIALVSGQVTTDDGGERLVQAPGLKYLYDHYPAIKIARLAVDRRVGGLGLGRELVNLALGRAKNIVAPAVGCRFVIVDAKKGAVRFYERCGFTLLNTAANQKRDEPVLFLDLNKIAVDG